VLVGDSLLSINGEQPRDVIEYQMLVDEPLVTLEIDRGGLTRTVEIEKRAGEPLGLEVHAALFDQVRTCDNHCSFCFIYQLPKGMRRSLYLKDDDYRLSFLYGNFTTLTRFTEADLERVITEGLSPLYVSIHATDRETRAALLRNRRGATSLRWLRALLDHGVEVHGQVVVCPGVNDGEVLADTLLGVLDRYPELASVAVVPLGVSDHSNEPDMRPHTRAEAEAVVDLVEEWQEIYRETLGRRLVFAADEYYLLADRDFPSAEVYDDFSMLEDGIGMARAFEVAFNQRIAEDLVGLADGTPGDAGEPASSADGVGIPLTSAGFFASVDGAPAAGYRAHRDSPESGALGPMPDDAFDQELLASASARAATTSGTARQSSTASQSSPASQSNTAPPTATPVTLGPRRSPQPAADAPIAILTGPYGAAVLGPIVEQLERTDVRLVTVENRFFGGNIGVTGLMVGDDVARHLAEEPEGHRYLLPDVCLSGGVFLDGVAVEDLPRPVEVVATDGAALRRLLDATPRTDS
jgi:NifB/MoaA-like Fe-S oxidoreductase